MVDVEVAPYCEWSKSTDGGDLARKVNVNNLSSTIYGSGRGGNA